MECVLSVGLILNTPPMSSLDGSLSKLSQEFDMLEVLFGHIEELPKHLTGNPLQRYLASIRLNNPKIIKVKHPSGNYKQPSIDARENTTDHHVCYVFKVDPERFKQIISLEKE